MSGNRSGPGAERAIKTLLASDVRLLSWARPYDPAAFRWDLLAGLAMAAILVPQSMAYAILAGLPPEVGLYAATVPVAVYAIFGSSLHLSVGPVALVSLLTLSAVSQNAPPGQEVQVAGLLALMVGVASLLMGVARVGFLVNYISQPVLIGFTAAAALIIAASQVRGLTGADAKSGDDFVSIARNFLDAISTVELGTTVFGVAAVVLLLIWRRRLGLPGPLVVAVLATAAAWSLGLDEHGLAVVGAIPRGLPSPNLGGIDASALVVDLLPATLVITVIGYLESIAIAKAYASRLGYRVRPSQEMIALGLGNVSAGAFGGYPVSGSFSRTAANVQAGARTPVSKLVAAGVVLVVIVAATPVLEHMPTAALAAIIIVAVSSLIDWREIRRASQSHRRDFAVLGLAFGLTLLLGVEIGLGLAIGASLLLVGARGIRSRTDEIASVLPDGVVGLTVKGRLTFANHRGMRKQLSRLVKRDGVEKLTHVVVDLTPIHGCDLSAERALDELIDDYAQSDIAVHIVCPDGPVRELLGRTGLLGAHGPNIHRDLASALSSIRGQPRPPGR